MNPLKNMMSSFGNPQQMLMNMLSQNNPQAFQQFQMLMNSGKNPQVILNQLMSGLNVNQKAQLEQMAKQFGLR
jgi:DNA polymerase III gamma/tau subunit